MSDKGSDDSLVQAAVGILLKSPDLSVPQAMRAANFSGRQSQNMALRARVRRLHTKRLGVLRKEAVSPPPFSIGSTSSAVSAVSGLTAGSPAPQSVIHPPPKQKQMRKTTTQTQQSRSDTKIMSNHEKKAFKRATTRYAEEKAKPKGLSAQKVCDEIEAEYQVTFGQRRIQTYVKNGEIGTSPRKTGNPGTIADYIFQLLCTATESFMKINQLNSINLEKLIVSILIMYWCLSGSIIH